MITFHECLRYVCISVRLCLTVLPCHLEHVWKQAKVFYDERPQSSGFLWQEKILARERRSVLRGNWLGRQTTRYIVVLSIPPFYTGAGSVLFFDLEDSKVGSTKINWDLCLRLCIFLYVYCIYSLLLGTPKHRSK